MKKLLVSVYFMLCFAFMSMRTAQAYIDPSSMTYLIQIIAGAAIAIGAGLGFYWKRIKRYFRRKKEEKVNGSISETSEMPDDAEDIYDPTVEEDSSEK